MVSKINQWVIVTCGLVLAAFAGIQTGFLQDILGKDKSFIALGIIGVFVVCHFTVARQIMKFSEEIEARLWFVAEWMIACGMVGTVVGFIMIFGEAFTQLDVSNPETIATVLVDMAHGVGTALVTTLVGLLCSFTLKGELVFLSEDL